MSVIGELFRAAPGGFAAIKRGQMAGAEQRRQRERQEKLDARSDEMAALNRALTMAKLSDEGIHEGPAPAGPDPTSAITDSIGVGGVDPLALALSQGMAGVEGERYESLGPGYHRDRLQTPETRSRQAAMDSQRAATAAHRSAYDATVARFGEKAVGPYSSVLDYQDLYEKILAEGGQDRRADEANKSRERIAREREAAATARSRRESAAPRPETLLDERAKFADRFIQAAGGDAQRAMQMATSSPGDLALAGRLGMTRYDYGAAAQRFKAQQERAAGARKGGGVLSQLLEEEGATTSAPAAAAQPGPTNLSDAPAREPVPVVEPGSRGAPATSRADLWEELVSGGMSPDQATAEVYRRLGRP